VNCNLPVKGVVIVVVSSLGGFFEASNKSIPGFMQKKFEKAVTRANGW
jgi:hypothetical protein